MKSIILKKLFSFFSIVICLTLMFSITVFAIPKDEPIIYDGIVFENEKDIERYLELDEAKKNTFKNDDDLIVLSISEEIICELPTKNPSSRSVIDPSKLSGRIYITTNSQRTSFYINFFVDWLKAPFAMFKDKMGVSWAGNSALLSSQCYVKKGDGYTIESALYSQVLRSEVGNNSFVSYEIGAYYDSYYLWAEISKASQSGLHNITGGYAHKTIGISGISVGVDSNKVLSFSAGFGTSFDTMVPVYTSSYLK